VLIVFFIFCILPLDSERKAAGQPTDPASLDVINEDFATGQPVYTRFVIYLNDLSPLSVYNRKVKESPFYLNPVKYPNAIKMFYFGTDKAIVFKPPYLRRSFHSKKNVYDMLRDRYNDSAVLFFASLVIASLFGIFFGIAAAIKNNSWIGKTLVSISLAGLSLPSFFVAIIAAWLFGFVLHAYTGFNMTGGLHTIDPFEGEFINWKNLVLPVCVLSLRPMALIFRQTRKSFLEVMSQPYILTAKAKGARKFMIIFNHAWLTTTAPLVTLSSRWLGSLLAGTVFVEFVFGWNGIGLLTVDAIDHADLPVLMGVVLTVAVFYIVLNALAELLYSTLDPRVDLK
jgi:peptide/nickel transport system permease protein